MPAWQIYVFRLQFFLVYFFGGLSKGHYDWLIRHYPLKRWFKEFKGETAFRWRLTRYCGTEAVAKKIERVLHHRWAPAIWSWGGFLIDLLVIPLLCYPPTRGLGVTLFLAFTFFNHWFFRLGAFPYINYAALFLFLDPSTSRMILDCFRGWGR